MKKQYKKINPKFYSEQIITCSDLYDISASINSSYNWKINNKNYNKNACKISENIFRLMYLNIIKFMNLTPSLTDNEHDHVYLYELFFTENGGIESETDDLDILITDLKNPVLEGLRSIKKTIKNKP